MTNRSIWIGFDPREAEAYAVARHTAERQLSTPVPIYGIVLKTMVERGLYHRPTQRERIGDRTQLTDLISEAPMSTEFAISRFLTVHLARERFQKTSAIRNAGWALFVDSDVMFRQPIEPLFTGASSKYAVMVVKHSFNPPEGTKMDGQAQLRYARKNWSSVMLFNLDHRSNDKLTIDLINTAPGRDLHRFCWLEDHEIGELHPCWNYLVGHHGMEIDPAIVHFTDGVPSMPGYEDVPYSDEWRRALERWAS